LLGAHGGVPDRFDRQRQSRERETPAGEGSGRRFGLSVRGLRYFFFAAQRIAHCRSAGGQPQLLLLFFGAGAACVFAAAGLSSDALAVDVEDDFRGAGRGRAFVVEAFFSAGSGSSSGAPVAGGAATTGSGVGAAVGVGAGVGAGGAATTTGSGGGGAAGRSMSAAATAIIPMPMSEPTMSGARLLPCAATTSALVAMPPSGGARVSGAVAPSGGASGATAGTAAVAALAFASLFTAAAVSAFRSMRPESSLTAPRAAGRVEGRCAWAAEVSALSEKSTEDSFRDPVDDGCSGALVATSSSAPARLMPPKRSPEGRTEVLEAARGSAEGRPERTSHGDGAFELGPLPTAETSSGTSASGFQSVNPSVQT